MAKKVLPNTSKTKEYLNKLEDIWIVGLWAKYGVAKYKFSGKVYSDKITPLVYHYFD